MTEAEALLAPATIAQRFIAALTLVDGTFSGRLRISRASKTSCDTVSADATCNRYNLRLSMRFNVNTAPQVDTLTFAFGNDAEQDMTKLIQKLERGDGASCQLARKLRDLVMVIQYRVLAFLVYNKLPVTN